MLFSQSAVCTCIHLAFIGVTVGLYVTGYSILPVDFNKIPMIWNEDIASTRMRAWRERNSDGTTIPRYVLTKLRDRYYPRYTIELYYRARDGDVFTKRNLQTMQRIEHSLTNISEYQSKFCLLDENLNCTKPLSILRYFDGTYASANSALNDPNFDDIANVLFYADRSPETSELLQVFLARDALINKAFALSKYTRTIIPIGWPLTNTTDATARFEKYLIENIEPILLEIQRCHNSDTFLTFNYYSYELMQKDIHTAAMNDLKFVAGSFAFILVFIIIHTRSLWLSAVSIFGILSSFVITNVSAQTTFSYTTTPGGRLLFKFTLR
ncbi:uncharacterized protein LOC141909214 [Tubulanus polymorphus]|uniref:uncharacterized protein LOC141909214 n=1 Tax=Tubulanus polymorphus TaxID=672921 RepID=UPI003DA3A162